MRSGVGGRCGRCLVLMVVGAGDGGCCLLLLGCGFGELLRCGIELLLELRGGRE